MISHTLIESMILNYFTFDVMDVNGVIVVKYDSSIKGFGIIAGRHPNMLYDYLNNPQQFTDGESTGNVFQFVRTGTPMYVRVLSGDGSLDIIKKI